MTSKLFLSWILAFIIVLASLSLGSADYVLLKDISGYALDPVDTTCYSSMKGVPPVASAKSNSVQQSLAQFPAYIVWQDSSDQELKKALTSDLRSSIGALNEIKTFMRRLAFESINKVISMYDKELYTISQNCQVSNSDKAAWGASMTFSYNDATNSLKIDFTLENYLYAVARATKDGLTTASGLQSAYQRWVLGGNPQTCPSCFVDLQKMVDFAASTSPQKSSGFVKILNPGVRANPVPAANRGPR